MTALAEKILKTLHHYRRRGARAWYAGWWELRRPRTVRPIFVLGCSRAGTTLLYKTLSESRELGSLQRETHDFWVDLHPLSEKNWDTHGLTAADASDRDRDFVSKYFYTWTGSSRWVDKNNQNGLCVDYLARLFPDAMFVYIKRSPGDNLNSLIEGWGKPEEFATWSDRLPATVSIENRYKRWCFFLADGWREYLNRPLEDICAFQYRTINRAIIEARTRIPAQQWIEAKYEEFLVDPVATFRSIFIACGLSFDSRLEAHCSKVLGIPYNAFSEIRLDKWKDGAHRDRVARALPQVAAIAHAMGYAAV
ncbi:MAG: sulfotransferase [Gammaproteobacteria bacterium]|nr:sulfotransferase [Gammaproteobacteria bacterium]